MTYSGAVKVGGPADVHELQDLMISKVAVGPMDNNAYLLRCRATDQQLLIDAANEPETLRNLIGDDGIARYSGHDASGPGGNAMLLFDVPIRYQSKVVGELRLGVSNAPLVAAQRTTFWVIATVLGVTLLAVVGAAYWLFRQPLALLGMLGEAMLRVARGDFSHRIRLVRRDELGRLFAAFNLMNSALQSRPAAATSPRAAADEANQPTLVIPPPAANDDAR